MKAHYKFEKHPQNSFAAKPPRDSLLAFPERIDVEKEEFETEKKEDKIK